MLVLSDGELPYDSGFEMRRKMKNFASRIIPLNQNPIVQSPKLAVVSSILRIAKLKQNEKIVLVAHLPRVSIGNVEVYPVVLICRCIVV
jgi:hypothetical protein